MFEVITYIIYFVADFVLSYFLTKYWINKKMSRRELDLRAFLMIVGIVAIWTVIK